MYNFFDTVGGVLDPSRNHISNLPLYSYVASYVVQGT